ncbi:DMT family transporter [Actinocorallia aurantiaca]|uniref:Magnesium transporter NIPA n=1 Tax=Actinocorallia aurantiaca TaxID=46204 RepID=A0ABN3UF63_9ACTN
MDGVNLGSVGAALLGTSVYYVAFLFFRQAASRMPPLRGSRPFHAAWNMLTDGVWFTGGILLFIGLAYEVIAFSSLPLGVAQPVFTVSLVLLLAYATLFLGERLSAREWTSVAMFGVATVMLGLSAAETDGTDLASRSPTAPELMLVTIPPLLIAGLVWLVGDRRRGGRHARPLAGVAYGIGAGVCSGVAETGIRGIAAVWASEGTVWALVTSPFPYLTLGMAAIALAQLQIALQRCRITIVATLITVTGRTMLVLCSPVLFDEPWPDGLVPTVLRTGGFVLTLLAIVLFPRHEMPRPSVAPRYGPRRREPAPAPAREDRSPQLNRP